ncbi:MAG: nucleotidyltransferase domain-containing protein [Defluviitaleaceae bacterium]|nr:nucleotidyltransferase domain-containing protein [Defluviitaleaceae bacterium]MCL2274259.1 nucleotidyltransferase domain-containing protein [Defluviitaleaceae bacterium]
MDFYTFNPNFPEPFSLIHPLKVNLVIELVEETPPEYVQFVILFGSSLDLTCTPLGDIDLYVISEEDKNAYEFFYKRCKALKIKADILVSSAKNFMDEALDINTIERKILEHGVVVYEKKSYVA